jgi:lysophospholipase L1-like esterase
MRFVTPSVLLALCLSCSFTAPLLRAQTTPPEAPAAPQPKRVACVGDSITLGIGIKNKESGTYPAKLQRLLGEGWLVRNFGVVGATLMEQGDRPYQDQQAFQQALDSSPDVVVIMLGTWDTRPVNRRHLATFAGCCRILVGKFQALPSKPRILLCRPPLITGELVRGINEPTLQQELPLLDAVAENMGLELVDIHAALTDPEAHFIDGVHPTEAGAELIARAVFKTLTHPKP